jgi:primosomal protein N''
MDKESILKELETLRKLEKTAEEEGYTYLADRLFGRIVRLESELNTLKND